MKTAISVPDDLFAQVDRLARRSHRSRSEVYSAALREYVARHSPDEVTAGLDAALAGLDQRPGAGDEGRLSIKGGDGYAGVKMPGTETAPAGASGIEVAVWDPTGSLGSIKGGLLKPLAVASDKRLPALPDVPTVAQTGLGQVNVAMWFGVFAPRGLAAEQVASLNHEINQILATDEVKTAFSTQGMDPATGTPAEFARLVERDADKWARLVKAQGIKPE